MQKSLLFVTVLAMAKHSAIASLPRLPSSLAFQFKFDPFDADRIVGGIAAKKGELPYQVSLQGKSVSTGINHHFCGGSLVSSTCVVTAAHCAEGHEPESLFVMGGSTTLEGTVYAVKEINVNPAYDPATVYNDIAVIKLANPVTFTDDLQPIAVARDRIQTPAGAVTTVSGWGTTAEMGSLSDDLLYTEVPTLTDADCRSKYGNAEIADSMICAGSDKGGKDSCQGDSGGPLVGGSGINRELIGIVSWGYGCARPAYPGVYTEVSYFTDFLQKENCI